MQFQAPLHQKQSQTRARPRSHVGAAVESFEELLLVLFGNANSAVADHAYRVRPFLFYEKLDRSSRLRILRGVHEQIGENVAEQPFVRLSLGWDGMQR